MKAACLALVMIGYAAFIHGASYASSPNPALQEQSSATYTKPLGGDHPTDAAAVENGKRQKLGTHSDEQRTRRHISGKDHSHSRASLTKTNRPKQLRNGRERSTPGDVTNVRQPSSGKSAAGAAKIANGSSLPVRRAGVGALNGTQVKDSRNRSVAPAIIGRTASTTKSSAAINGTSINRRHMN